MTPIYFPFTALSPNNISLLGACCFKTTVYQISETLFENDLSLLRNNPSIHIRMPVSGDEERLAAVLKEYKNFAGVHDAKTAAILKAQSNPIPFYSDTSVSKIRMDLKNKISDGEKEQIEMSREDAFTARLFLALAQEHDSHMAGLIDDLISMEQIEQNLYDRLKGEPEDLKRLRLLGNRSVDRDLGAHMTAERIRSWALLFLKDTEEFGVFITDSQGVLNHIADADTDAAKGILPLFTIGSIPIRSNKSTETETFCRTLGHLLDELAQNPHSHVPLPLPEPPKPGPGEKTASMAVYLASGIHPKDFFKRFVIKADGITDEYHPSLVCNTVVCLVKRN